MNWMKAFTQSPDGLLHSNGEVCCILGVCCPPEAALAALVSEFEKQGAVPEYAQKCAQYVFESFDLAPKGSLQSFKDYVAQHARHSHHS